MILIVVNAKKNKVTKLCLSVPDETIVEIKRIAQKRNTTLTQVVKNAIHFNNYARSNDRRLLFEKHGTITEIDLNA